MSKIVILDAGSQYGKLIDRRIRELNVDTEIMPLDTPFEKIESMGFNGIVISGGPDSVFEKTSQKCDPLIFKNESIPVLGICYGMQLMNMLSGGMVTTESVREDGQIEIKINNEVPLFDGLEETETVLLTHGDSIKGVPDTLKVIAQSNHAISAIKDRNLEHYGVQFHPEVDLTVNGQQIFSNFLFKICNCDKSFTLENRLDSEINKIKSQVGNKKVVVLASGGVDSTVCAALLFKALSKDQVYVIHIDNGFMRLCESDNVKEALESTFPDHHIKVLDCRMDFLLSTTSINGKETRKLNDTCSPEEKRKIIGDTFMRIITKEIENLCLDDFLLCQGTLRPDLIESASKLASANAQTIKTHHNDTNLVREKRNQGLIIEPLKDYHKDEVRELGLMLGLNESMVYRHPFPGPGLAIRILCKETPELDDEYFEVRNNLNEYYYANEEKMGDIDLHLLPIKSVGVQGDGRSYSYVAGITSSSLDWPKFFELAKDIPKVIHKVNRVVFIFGAKLTDFCPSSTPTKLNLETTDQLRLADHLFNIHMKDYQRKIAQAPVILTPANFGKEGYRSIVLRPFVTRDFMTGLPAVPNQDLPQNAILNAVMSITMKVPKIAKVMLDLTSKPPGTTEWE